MAKTSSALYFDQAAAQYTAQYQAPTPAGYALRERQQRVLELVDRSEGKKLLDAGCGPAYIAPELFKLGYDYWGIDAAPKMLEQYYKQSNGTGRAYLSVGDVTCIALPNNFFDALICIGVLDRVKDHDPALAELVRVVKPNGTIIIWFPNLISPYAFWKNFIFYPGVALIRPFYFRLLGKPEPPSIYNRANGSGWGRMFASFAKLRIERSTAKIMAGYGVAVTEVVYTNFNLFLSPLDEWFPKLAMKTTERLAKLRFGKLRWLGAGFIIKAKKRP